ncbi:hypothetical protein ACIRYZ_27870 [Kitasatospora sp. NPDC101155]|uniref:hypothetical protein n=1 Tax=Kitasatospora sp. NPDC101155 TaxID=3364097 RepID=UPI0038225690
MNGRGGYWTVENMGELDDLRARLAALEAEVDRLREESAATRAPAAAVAADRDDAEVRSPAPERTPVPDAVRADRAGQRQSMTGLADVLGVMVSGQAEQTMLLRAQTRTLETQSSTLTRHGRFLESLLEGQSALFEELRRDGR